MLPQQHRIRKKRDFDTVYRGGKTLNTALFRIKTAPNQLPITRYGIVVPNKVIKKAVQRNRYKRKVRAALQDLLPHILPGYDIVVMVQSVGVDAPYTSIREDLEAGFTKIRFIQHNDNSIQRDTSQEA